MYILDTDVISNFRKLKPHPNLLAWFGSLPAEDVAISVMTVFEITVGATLVRMTDAERADNIERWLENFVLTTGIDIFAVDTDIAQLYARMFVTPSLRNFVLPDERSKRPKSGADLVIAATAIAHRATVVTADIDDFLRIHAEFPLPSLFDPFAVQWSFRATDGSHGV